MSVVRSCQAMCMKLVSPGEWHCTASPHKSCMEPSANQNMSLQARMKQSRRKFFELDDRWPEIAKDQITREKLLHIQEFLPTNALIHRHLHTSAFTPTFLRTDALKHRRVCTETLLHRNAARHWPLRRAQTLFMQACAFTDTGTLSLSHPHSHAHT